MNYNRKIMQLELYSENYLGGYYYSELLLPAAHYEIKDAMQKVRAAGREDKIGFNIYGCDIFPELLDVRLDTASIDELNFLAKRLVSLTDEELPVFYAVTDEIFREADDNGLVSIKDLINCTYGLDTVPIASGISGLEALGRFAVENGLLADLDGIPESVVPFLNFEQIGRVQQKNDKGVFEDGFYVPTVHYERPEVYDGMTLPTIEPKELNFVFRLLVSGTPENTNGDPEERAVCLYFPTSTDSFERCAEVVGEANIYNCVYYDFESAIPQITSDMFDSMKETDTLNALAERIAAMCENKEIKFKAVLDSENTATVKDALNAADNLWRYVFTDVPDTADAFFKKYVAENTDTSFDSRWLAGLVARNEGERLLDRLGATLTDYGVVSARYERLFEPVPYDEPGAKEINTQAVTYEKPEIIEILDRKALFSNGRLSPEEIPEGLYAYDLRRSDDGSWFCSVEPRVGINYGGTILLKETLDFGNRGYIPLNEGTEPNFTGEEMTAEEFAEEETLDESMQMRGM